MTTQSPPVGLVICSRHCVVVGVCGCGWAAVKAAA